MEQKKWSSPEKAWKGIVSEYPKEFFELFFPKAAKNIDFSKPITFLEGVLEKIEPAYKMPGTAGELLFKASAQDKKEQEILFHLIILGSKPDYFYVDLYYTEFILKEEALEQLPMPLVMLIDTDPEFYPKKAEIYSDFFPETLHLETAKLLCMEEQLAGENSLLAECVRVQMTVSRLQEKLHGDNA